jgi:murein DD-endopeptidase MepM/ murein hydrolase activator NlpD
MTILFFAMIAGGVYLKFTPEFEQDKPTISLDDNIFWNLKSKIKLKIEDASGIKYYKIVFHNGTQDIVLDTKVLSTPQKVLNLEIKPPKIDIFIKNTQAATITVEAVDNSKWNYLEGNKAFKTININIDKKPPVAKVIANTHTILYGGSAVAVVEVKDENIKTAFIKFNNVKFELIPFYKENYFVSLITWPMSVPNFQIVTLTAIDKAGNITKTKIPFYFRKLRQKTDKLKISDQFIHKTSTNVLMQSGEDIPDDLVKRFKKQNDFIRAKNIKTIRDVTVDNMDKNLINNFDIHIFTRLKGSRVVAKFAERRSYYNHNKKIDEQWHLGMDWASVKHAPIRISNDGTVVLKQYLGIYGDTMIVDHGMGLASLYAHTSSSEVTVGETLFRHQVIGNTGSTGAVLGDHLHFGVLVQGIEVNPKEWMDSKWIRTRITKILKQAKHIIDSK